MGDSERVDDTLDALGSRFGIGSSCLLVTLLAIQQRVGQDGGQFDESINKFNHQGSYLKCQWSGSERHMFKVCSPVIRTLEYDVVRLRSQVILLTHPARCALSRVPIDEVALQIE